MFFGEFFGTMMLVVFGDGVVANVLLKKSKAEGSGWLTIATGWGFAVMVGAFAANALGAQGDLNPAVTLAKAMNSVYSVSDAMALMIAEVAGGFVGGILVYLHFFPHWEITEDKDAKLGIFCTAPAVRNYTWNFWSELFGTFVLVIAIFFIFAKPNGVFPAGLGNYVCGVLIWAIGMSLGGTTGYAINPARDLGPRLAHAVLPIPGKRDSDWSYSWVPVLGPMVGGALAYIIAKAIGIL